MPAWSVGRLGLVGDAATCVSLLGDGSSRAIVGAHTLATALAATTDHDEALRRYQAVHQRRITSASAARLAGHMLVPSTRAGLGMRNTGLRVVDRLGTLTASGAGRLRAGR